MTIEDMCPEAFAKFFGHEAQMEAQAHFAYTMVAALPELIAARDLHPIAQTACLESFFINVRLMAEFLVRPADSRDFGAATLAAGWKPEPASAADRLANKWWPIASQLVAHFSRQRLQGDMSQPVDYVGSEDDLRAMRDDVTAVWNTFRARRGAAPVEPLS